MNSDLLRYAGAIARDDLAEYLTDPTRGVTQATGLSADLAAMNSSISSLIESSAAGANRAAWDAPTAKVLYEGLGDLPIALAVDMRFWHWLCIEPFSQFVWFRWLGSVPEDPGLVLTPALSERFLGTASLRGVSRNALARLYWAARTLRESDDDYSLVDRALANQDFFQAIFERSLGLYRPAATACLKVLGESSEERDSREVVIQSSAGLPSSDSRRLMRKTLPGI